jgi:hypothetical protein
MMAVKTMPVMVVLRLRRRHSARQCNQCDKRKQKLLHGHISLYLDETCC